MFSAQTRTRPPRDTLFTRERAAPHHKGIEAQVELCWPLGMERVEEPTGIGHLLVREDLVDPQRCLGCEARALLTHTGHDGGDEGPVAEGVT